MTECINKCLPRGRGTIHSAVFAVVRCPSVRLFVTLMYRNGQTYFRIFSSSGGPIILVFKIDISKLKFWWGHPMGHPQQGRQFLPNRGGGTKNLRFSTSISEIPIPNTEPTWKNTDENTEYRYRLQIPIPTQLYHRIFKLIWVYCYLLISLD